MKTSNIICIAISALTISSLLMGCSEDVYESAYRPSLESHYLSVSPRDFQFGNGEETKTGSITSENSWSFTGTPSWLSLAPSSGNSDADFSITSSANETMVSKTAVFYVSAKTSDWSQQRQITASQAAATPFFQFVNLESTSIYLTGESHTLTIDVESNIDDLAVKIYDADGWISASYQNKKLTISVGINDDGYTRDARVQLWSSSYSKGDVIYITQYKPNLSFDEISSLSFDADGGTQTISVNSEIPWIALSKESWIEITPSEGQAGNNQVKIKALPSYQNETRNGKVLFYYKDNQSSVASVSISQTGRYLNISPTSVTLSAEENSSVTVELSSNIGWEIYTCPEWLSVSPNKGNAGESKISITAQNNNSLNSRSGTITIKDSMTGGIGTSLSVIQNGLDFGDQTTIEFGWQMSTRELFVPIPNKWNAAVSDGWITLSQYSGVGETLCDITVSRNDSQETRTGQIIFSSEGQNITVSVVQEGQYITIDATAGEISAMGGSAELHIDTTIDVMPSIEYDNEVTDWITYEKVSENVYKLSIEYNPSINQRYATFILKPQNSDVKDELANGIRYSIKQFGRDLRVEPSKIILSSKGGTTESYSIVADGSYSIEKPSEYAWFTLVHDEDNSIYYIVATENKTDATREGNIIVSLTNLPEGEVENVIIKVIQSSIYNSDINYNDYDDDQLL